MSAWSKQAIPLIFIEVSVSAMSSKNKDNSVERVRNRAYKWIQKCWDQLAENKGNQKDDKAMKKAVDSSERIKAQLSKMWRDGLETNSELTVALCIIAEDTIDSMPKDKQRRYPWLFLLRTLYDMWKLSDPEEAEWKGYLNGKVIASKVMEAAI